MPPDDLLRIISDQAAALERMTAEAERLRQALAEAQHDLQRYREAAAQTLRLLEDLPRGDWIARVYSLMARSTLTEAEANTLEAVEGAPAPLSAKEIARASGHSLDRVKHTLPRLVAIGLVRKVRGGYAASGHLLGTLLDPKGAG